MKKIRQQLCVYIMYTEIYLLGQKQNKIKTFTDHLQKLVVYLLIHKNYRKRLVDFTVISIE